VAPVLTEALADGWDPMKIKIPSPWNVNGYKRSNGPDHHDYPTYPAAWEKYDMAWMRKTVEIPADWKGRQLILHFEAVAGAAEVYVNGKKVGENFDLFLPFQVDITALAKPGQTAEIRVGVRHHKLFNKNTSAGRRVVPAGSMWGQYIAGIWQDVYLLAIPRIHVEDIYAKPLVSDGVLELEVTLRNHLKNQVKVSVGGVIQDWVNLAGNEMLDAPVSAWKLGGEVLKVPETPVILEAESVKTVTLSVKAGDKLNCWTPETPHLYGLTLAVSS
jgi:beta-galactosidase